MNNFPECLLCKNNHKVEQVTHHETFEGNIYYCHKCDFGFCSPMPNDIILHNYYTKEYRVKRGNNFSYSYKLKGYKYAWSRYKYLFDFLPKHKDSISVLDIGCSFAPLLEYFHDNGAVVYGTESNIQAIKNTSPNIANRTKQEFDFYQEYSGKRFDVIVLSHVLEHFNNLENLAKCRELLKEDGILFVEVPNEDRTYIDYRKIRGFGSHLMWFSHRALKRLGKKFGLEIVPNSVKTYNTKKGFIDFLPQNHPLKIKYQKEWKKKEWGDSFEPNLLFRFIPTRVACRFLSSKIYAKMFHVNFFSSSELGAIIRIIYRVPK